MEIDITSPQAAFEAHINPKENKRILFSGPFGIGKTYFLDKFFEKRSEYFVVKISPINYVLGSNADVFELLKYDVLYEILCKEKMVIDDELSPVTRAEMPNEVFKTLKEIASGLTSVGKSIIEIADKINRLQKRLIEIEKKSKELPGYEKIKELINEIEKSNFILKADYLTAVINRSLEELQEGTPGVKRILIIDDIDRIDPEHIFRLFNVFGAHFPDNNAHKFEFDKVIFVCDVNNIRSVFAAKYGIDADFNGYLDKFYSDKVFSFSNKSAVCLWLKRYKIYFGHPVINAFIVDLFSYFISIGILNLRELKKVENITVAVVEPFNDYLIRKNNILFFYAFEVIESLLGSISVLLDKLNLVLSNEYFMKLFRVHEISQKRSLYFSSLLLPIIVGRYNNFDTSNENTTLQIPNNKNELNPFVLRLKISYEGIEPRIQTASPVDSSQNSIDVVEYVWLIKEAIAIAKDLH
jgi:hypothetical protein